MVDAMSFSTFFGQSSYKRGVTEDMFIVHCSLLIHVKQINTSKDIAFNAMLYLSLKPGNLRWIQYS